VRPRVVSVWRQRFADHGLDGIKDKPRPGKKPIYDEPTTRHSGTFGSAAAQGLWGSSGPLLAAALGDVDVQYVWVFLRAAALGPEIRSSLRHGLHPGTET